MVGMTMLMTADERVIALEYYALDENVLLTPQECYNINVNLHGASDASGHAYVLRSVSSVPNFWGRFHLLQSALRNAAEQFWPNAASMHLRDPHSQHPVKFFFFSITEEEISRGVFWRDSARMPSSVHVFQRTLQASGGGDLQQMPVDAAELKNYIDLSSDKTSADLIAARLIKEQQQMIALSLTQSPACLTSFPPLEWQDGQGIDPSHPQHAAYLQQFAEVALNRLLDSMDEARERLAVEPHAGMAEAIFHLKFAKHRARLFAHSQETQHVTTKLREYLASPIAPGHAFIIHGASGSGKTYLMAEASDREARALNSAANADNAVIVRFLGTSPSSSNITALLDSICKQLHSISPNAARLPSSDDEDTEQNEDEHSSDVVAELPSSEDVEKLMKYFKRALKTWNAGRLTVFLDSLDQLDDTCGGRKLGWLPTQDLSPNVRLVISTLPDEVNPADGKAFACLSILQQRYRCSPSDCAMAEVQPVDNVRSLLLHLLKLRHHKLSDAQLQGLETAIKLSPKTQTPLVVSILAVRFCEWPSHRSVPVDNKNADGSLFVDTSTVRALIIQEFKTMEAKHGADLVRASLSFITLAKDGISETELSEILSLDDDVLASVYEWWVPSVRTLPTNPLTMLLADLRPYLTMRGAASGGGGLMMRWYHRQFWEAADAYFLHDGGERRRRSAQLGEFFIGTWADRSKPYNDKLKAAVQKKVTGEVSGDRRVRPQPLCLKEGKNVFMTKGDAGAVNERRCREAAHHLLAACMLCETANELCCFEGIFARARCGEGFALLQDLLELESRIRTQVGCGIMTASHLLRKVHHYARWLRKDMSTVAAHPEAIFSTCSRQPTTSLAREDLKKYLQHTSGGVSFERNAFYRSFAFGVSLQEFDCCIAELKYHKVATVCVAFNVDGTLLACASEDASISIWNANTGVLLGVLVGPVCKFRSVAWAPDSSQLATSCDSSCAIRFWDARTLQQIETPRNEGSAFCAVFDASGMFLASGGTSGLICLWNARTHQVISTLKGHNDFVRAVAFDASGRYLVSGSDDTTVRLWDMHSHQAIATLQHESKPWKKNSGNPKRRWVHSVAINSFGNRIVSGCEDGSIFLWDVHSHRKIAKLPHASGTKISSIAFDATGRYIASVDRGHFGAENVPCIRLWDVHTLQVITTLLPQHGCSANEFALSVAFNSRGNCIASSCSDGTVFLWDAHQAILTSSGFGAFARGSAPMGWFGAVDVNGRYIASVYDHVILVWDVHTHQMRATLLIENSGPMDNCAVAFDTSGRYIVCANRCNVYLFDIRSQKSIATLQNLSEGLGNLWVNSIAFDANGQYIVAGCRGIVRIWDAHSYQEIAILKPENFDDVEVEVAFDASGRYIVTSHRHRRHGSDGTFCLWDAHTYQEIATLECCSSGSEGSDFPFACHPSGPCIAIGSSVNSMEKVAVVTIWDLHTRQSVAVLHGHSDNVRAVAFDASGRYLVSGSDDTTVRLWDMHSHQAIATLRGHSGSVCSLAFDTGGRYIVSGSLECIVWDAHNYQAITTMTGHTGAVNPSSAGLLSEMTSLKVGPKQECISMTHSLAKEGILSLKELKLFTLAEAEALLEKGGMNKLQIGKVIAAYPAQPAASAVIIGNEILDLFCRYQKFEFTYVGPLRNNLRHGTGRCLYIEYGVHGYKPGDLYMLYEGEFKNGSMDGQGTMTLSRSFFLSEKFWIVSFSDTGLRLNGRWCRNIHLGSLKAMQGNVLHSDLTDRKCPDGHQLRVFNEIPTYRRQCELCRNDFPKECDGGLHCSTCKFDLCLGCHLRSFYWRCPKGHTLICQNCKPSYYRDIGKRWECNGCKSEWDSAAPGILHCKTCKYDLCKVCRVTLFFPTQK